MTTRTNRSRPTWKQVMALLREVTEMAWRHDPALPEARAKLVRAILEYGAPR